ncbi:MAG: lysylphosphatidylglycerol synthase transmembrane domain-containing protein [Chloroflexi bacterium]|nr:lysylphosphatidylglycerol synthase transmembrane domain-containing protein [Chloroflexota bacterium]MDA1272206.1 lysylphosphatidylglycerol synthase transmembrane domain-containing protein [Chloroflexota bacterium]
MAEDQSHQPDPGPHGQDSEDSVPKPLLRRVLSLPALIALGLAAVFLVFMVTRFDVDLGATWDRIKNADPWLLLLAFAVHYTTFVFRGIRWRLLLQNTAAPGIPVPGAFYCSQLVLLGWFANSVGWLRLGDAYRAYLYRDEQNGSFSRTIGTILAERALDTVLVAVLLLAAVPFLLDSGDGVTWVVLGLAVALVAGLAVMLASMTWARGLLLRRLPDWLGVRYARFHQGTMGSFQRVPEATVWGLLGWGAEIARMYLVVQALGFDISFALVVFLTLANSLLTLVPTPGGVGAVESGVGGLAARLSSISVSAAAALVLIDRAITYISVIILGAGLFLARQAFWRTQPAGPVRTEDR